MARHNGLASLASEATEAMTAGTTDSVTPKVRKSQRSVPTDSKPDNTGEPAYYATLARKEARLRLDQADDLTTLRRTLNRQRAGEGERITDNTLIRVAVDLLLQQQDSLAGADEAQLRASLEITD